MPRSGNANIRPNTAARKFDDELGVAESAWDQWSILRPTGIDGSARLKFDDTPTALNATGARGVLYVAKTDLRAGNVGDVNALASPHCLVGPVDLTGASVHDPVYLSDTAGAFSLSAGTVTRVIGKVVVAGATGYYQFCGFETS